MNRVQFISEISKKTQLPKKTVASALNNFEAIIADRLAKGEKVTITGFGTFVLSKRSAREGVSPRNPSQRIQIPASVVPHFRAGEAFKKKLR